MPIVVSFISYTAATQSPAANGKTTNVRQKCDRQLRRQSLSLSGYQGLVRPPCSMARMSCTDTALCALTLILGGAFRA